MKKHERSLGQNHLFQFKLFYTDFLKIHILKMQKLSTSQKLPSEKLQISVGNWDSDQIKSCRDVEVTLLNLTRLKPGN